jgi:hypothetical protein
LFYRNVNVFNSLYNISDFFLLHIKTCSRSLSISIFSILLLKFIGERLLGDKFWIHLLTFTHNSRWLSCNVNFMYRSWFLICSYLFVVTTVMATIKGIVICISNSKSKLCACSNHSMCFVTANLLQ